MVVAGLPAGTHRVGEALEQFLLFFRQVLRRDDVEADNHVAAAAAAQVRYTLAAHDEHLAGLRAGGNAEVVVRAVDRRDGDLVAERDLREVDLELEQQRVVVALEEVVLADADLQVEVAARAALGADLALAGEAHLRSVVDAGGDVHGQLALALLAARAAAVLAGVGDDTALAAAAIAGGHVDELAEDALLGAAHLAGAVALGAALGLRAGLGAQSIADGADLGGLDLDLLVRAEDRFLEADRDAAADVGAARGAAVAARLRPAEERIEDVAEAAEALEPAREALGAALRGGMAEAVVHGAALRVGEDLVRLVDLLEAGLGFGRLIAVRVELHRQAAEGLLDLVGARAAREAEQVVVVLLAFSRHVSRISGGGGRSISTL